MECENILTPPINNGARINKSNKTMIMFLAVVKEVDNLDEILSELLFIDKIVLD